MKTRGISLIWSETLVEPIFNPCVEFRWSPEGPLSRIHSPHIHVGATGIFSDLLRSVQMLKRELGAKSNRKLPNIFIPSKTATLVPEFAVNDLPLSRTLWWWWWWWWWWRWLLQIRTLLDRRCSQLVTSSIFTQRLHVRYPVEYHIIPELHMASIITKNHHNQ